MLFSCIFLQKNDWETKVYTLALKRTCHVEYNFCVYFLTSLINFFFSLLIKCKLRNIPLLNLLYAGKDTEVFHGIFSFGIVTDLRLSALVCHLETEISLQIYQKATIPLGSKLGLEQN